MTENVYLHLGDLGDVIAALPTIKALGRGKLVICPPSGAKNQGRESLRGTRFNAISPLLEAQPYLSGVEWSDEVPANVTHDFSKFRQGYIPGESLADWQARHMRVKIDTSEPWLTARRSGQSIGRTIIARSVRYHNDGFPWFAVLGKFRDIMFVGLKEEYEAFQRQHGANVEFRPTKDLLELAELINGASQFVGNQSCPFWIAAGLGVPIIQEGWAHSPNSQIHRKNTKYLIRGPFQI